MFALKWINAYMNLLSIINCNELKNIKSYYCRIRLDIGLASLAGVFNYQDKN